MGRDRCQCASCRAKMSDCLRWIHTPVSFGGTRRLGGRAAASMTSRAKRSTELIFCVHVLYNMIYVVHLQIVRSYLCLQQHFDVHKSAIALYFNLRMHKLISATCTDRLESFRLVLLHISVCTYASEHEMYAHFAHAFLSRRCSARWWSGRAEFCNIASYWLRTRRAIISIIRWPRGVLMRCDVEGNRDVLAQHWAIANWICKLRKGATVPTGDRETAADICSLQTAANALWTRQMMIVWKWSSNSGNSPPHDEATSRNYYYHYYY